MAKKCYLGVYLDTVMPVFHETGYIPLAITVFSNQKDDGCYG